MLKRISKKNLIIFILILILLLIISILLINNNSYKKFVGIYQYTINKKTHTLKINNDFKCTIDNLNCKWELKDKDNIVIYNTYYGNSDNSIYNTNKTECDYYINLWDKQSKECTEKTKETIATITKEGVLIDNRNFIKIK